MDKVGSFIGRTVFGIISIAATAIVSVLVQRYMETITNAPTSILESVPTFAPTEPNEAAPIAPTEVAPVPVEPVPEAIETQPPSQVAEDMPDPLEADTSIDSSTTAPATSVDPNDAPVQVLFEEEQEVNNTSNNDSDIMQTFWDKLKNK